MPTHLVLQVLGNSDIRVDGEEGAKKLISCYTLEDIQEQSRWNDEELLSELERVDFPLIRRLRDEQQSQHSAADLLFGIILTNQTDWIQSQDIQGEGWNQIITSDGYWWKNLLSRWCEQEQIKFFPIPLSIDSTIPNGAADWEGMAAVISHLTKQIFQFDRRTLKFCPTVTDSIAIDKLIIQHSSGTPALSSALYLWGVEQKLANHNVAFAYVSVQDTQVYSHTGQHWQWRLKVPQVRQLLDLQDFSGAITLLKNYPDQSVVEGLQQLDKAVSFNVRALGLGLSLKDDVIERIGIALWSEQAFRLKGQWMHWYLRIAGAIELAVACLVEHQGNGSYKWQRTATDKLILAYRNPANNQWLEFRMPIKRAVKTLLEEGRGTFEDGDKSITCTVKLIPPSSEWKSFKDFYCNRQWNLGNQEVYSFLDLRNELYHSLLGDRMDQLLDDRTKDLGSVDHPNHPAKLAVGQLRYIIKLAGLEEDVNQRVEHYRNRVEAVKRSLA